MKFILKVLTKRYLKEDLYGKSRLSELLNELCKFDSFKWIRFLYAYPESITDELIKTVKENDKICNYFDIPIQHISDPVLKRMNRRTTGKKIEDLIIKIKKEIPGVVLRTSLIVGFPGETEEDFDKLYREFKALPFDNSLTDGLTKDRKINPLVKDLRYSTF